jgi:mRNA-degrading endonuclease RelE of RelBE toxin-antitoxin system
VAFRLVFAEAVSRHLEYLTAQQQATLIDAIETNLTHEPLRETRHRKRLPPNPIAPWELRVGALRVFFDADPAANRVHVLAVGIKIREKVMIGGAEVQL